MPQHSTQVPPRLSDLHGAERVQALRARAAAERERFVQQRTARRGGIGMFGWLARFAR